MDLRPNEHKARTTFAVSPKGGRSRSATARVSAKVEPGGSSTLICVCARSAAGTKPVGSSGTSEIEPTKNSAAAIMVRPRWRRHHCIVCM